MIDVKGLGISCPRAGAILLALPTAAAVPGVGVEEGICGDRALAGAAMRHSYRPHTMVLSPNPKAASIRPASPAPRATRRGSSYRFGADLFYANADRFADEARADRGRSRSRQMVRRRRERDHRPRLFRGANPARSLRRAHVPERERGLRSGRAGAALGPRAARRRRHRGRGTSSALAAQRAGARQRRRRDAASDRRLSRSDEADVPAGRAHRNETPIDVVPEREARAVSKRLELASGYRCRPI